MGRLQTQEYIELLQQRQALQIHLTSNHYPAVPKIMFPIAEKAIVMCDPEDEESWERLIRLPKGVTYRGSDFITVGDVIESWHLDEFVAAWQREVTDDESPS